MKRSKNLSTTTPEPDQKPKSRAGWEGRRKKLDADNSRLILAHLYPIIGRPAGLSWRKDGLPDPPGWQLGAVRPILDELYTIQGAPGGFSKELLAYLDQALAFLAREHPKLTIAGICQGLPRAYARIGGFGPWKHKQLEKLEWLYIPSELRLLHNNGIDCALVFNAERMVCLISKRSWDLSEIREASVEDICNGLYVGPGDGAGENQTDIP